LLWHGRYFITVRFLGNPAQIGNYENDRPLPSCSVFFVDCDGIRHAAQAQAASLYEAGCLSGSGFSIRE